MRAGPNRLMEALVSLLLPPACREHVLGDLYERYTSPRQYIADAALTLPLVIASRIRRTTDGVVLFMEAGTLYSSFFIAARFLDAPFLAQPEALLRLAIPPVVALAANAVTFAVYAALATTDVDAEDLDAAASPHPQPATPDTQPSTSPA